MTNTTTLADLTNADTSDATVEGGVYSVQKTSTPANFKLVAAGASPPDVVTVAGTSKTLALTDANTTQSFTSGSAVAVTLPLNATVAFPVDTVILFEQIGAGLVSLTGATGVTINGNTEAGGGESTVDSQGQWFGFYIRQYSANNWLAVGIA